MTSDLEIKGGTGFIAAHVLDILLEHGHSVVTTVRSEAKAQTIRDAHPKVPKEKLDFAIVEDIAVEGSFDRAVKSEPPFEKVIHCASPFHFNVTDVKKDLYVILNLIGSGVGEKFGFVPVVGAVCRLQCIFCCYYWNELLLKLILHHRLDPAIIGTTGLLKAIKKNTPTVKRVVITSSFAAIIDAAKGTNPGHT